MGTRLEGRTALQCDAEAGTRMDRSHQAEQLEAVKGALGRGDIVSKSIKTEHSGALLQWKFKVEMLSLGSLA